MRHSTGVMLSSIVFFIMAVVMENVINVHYGVAMLCVSHVCRAIEDKK